MNRQVIAVVGAGLAGVTATQTLRAEGFDGNLLLLGEEDVLPYDRPPLSKEYLLGTAEADDCFLHPIEWYRDHGIDLRLGAKVTAVNVATKRLTVADGDEIAFDKLLIATGSKPRFLPKCSDDSGRVFCLATLDDATRLRGHLQRSSRIAVIGGGFIGAEVASAARQYGCEVVVLESMDIPFQTILGELVGTVLLDVYRENGVDYRTGVAIESAQSESDCVHIRSVESQVWTVDAAVVGIGAGPATLPIGSPDGISVNALGQTCQPDIFAAGDVARRPEPVLGTEVRIGHWQNALRHSGAVAKAMLGGGTAFSDVPWFWSNQFGMVIQMAGLPRAGNSVVLRGDPDQRRFCAFFLDDGRLRAALGINRPSDIQAARRLIAGGGVVREADLADETCDLRAAAASR